MPEVAAHAARAYSRSNLRFVAGDVRSIPLRSASIDVVVSFETLEHITSTIHLSRRFGALCDRVGVPL